MLLRNSKTIIGISLTITLAAFGLFYSTAYAGDADGVIGDDNAFTFKQDHLEQTTQPYALAGTADLEMAWPAANKGADTAIVGFALGTIGNNTGAGQVFNTPAASTDGTLFGTWVLASDITAGNSSAAIAVTGFPNNLVMAQESGDWPKIVLAAAADCTGSALTGATETLANTAAAEFGGIVSVAVAGGQPTIVAGTYKMCYQTQAGIPQSRQIEVDISNAAHTPLNGTVKTTTGADCTAGALGDITTTIVDANTIRIAKGSAGSAIAAAVALRLCYDWGGSAISGTSANIDFTIGAGATNITGNLYNIQKVIADGGNCTDNAETGNVASYSIVDDNTFTITADGVGPVVPALYEVCYDHGGIRAGGNQALDPTGASSTEPVLALATNLYSGLKLVADAGTEASAAVVNTVVTKNDVDTVTVTSPAVSATQAFTSSAAIGGGVTTVTFTGEDIAKDANGNVTLVLPNGHALATASGGFPKLMATAETVCGGAAYGGATTTIANLAAQIAGTINIALDNVGSTNAIANATTYKVCYNIPGGILDGQTVNVDITGAAPLVPPQHGGSPTYRIVIDTGTCGTGAEASTTVTYVDADTVAVKYAGAALAAATAKEICYTAGGLNNATDYELVYTRGGISDAAVTNVDIAEAVNTPLLTANGTFRVVADAGTCATAASANTTTALVDANTVGITLAANQVLVPGAYEICYGYGKDPSKHFGWDTDNAGRTVKVTVGLNTNWANEVSAIEVFVIPAVPETGETTADSKRPNATFRMSNGGFFPTGNQLDLLFTCDEKCSPGALTGSTKIGIHVVKTTNGTHVDTFRSDNPTNISELNAMPNVGFKLDQTAKVAAAVVVAPTPTPTPVPEVVEPELPKAGGATPSNNLLITSGIAGTLLIIISSLYMYRRRAEVRIK
jgi:hypothetical protein